MTAFDPNATIFICSASADRDRALAAHGALSSSAMRPWCDAVDLAPGDTWDVAIPRALSGAVAVLVLVSNTWPERGESGASWYAPEEVARAIGHARRVANPPILVPVLLDGVAKERVPYGLSRLVAIEADGGDMRPVVAGVLKALETKASAEQSGVEDLGPKPVRPKQPEPPGNLPAPPAPSPLTKAIGLPPLPPLLIEAHAAGELAIMVGSGLSMGADVRGAFPGWTGIPRRILTDGAKWLVGWGQPRIDYELSGLEYISGTAEMLAKLDALKTALGRNYRRAMGQLFRPTDAAPGDAHRALVETGVRVVLTTNYDELIERVAGSERTKYTWRRSSDALADIGDGRPVVFKVHGCATDPESMVLTRREYDTLAADRGYRAVMEHLLTTHTVLFVGYGMNDPFDLDRLLRGRAELLQSATRTHFALMHRDETGDAERWQREHNVHAIAFDDYALIPAILRALASHGIIADAQAPIEVADASPPAPPAPDDPVQRELDDALGRLARLDAIGASETVLAPIRREVLDLKRALLHGGRPKAGYPLADRWVLLEVIGKGGFAEVWKAWDRRTAGHVAVKVLHGQFASSQERRDRFFRGARLMGTLEHPHIVRVIEPHAEDAGFHFFVMELVTGGDLHEALKRGDIETADAIEAICCVADALHVAHARDLVHRDVKPANILLGADGTAKLADFDLVRAGDTTGGTRTGALGTFIYAAPEAMGNAKEAGPPSDIFGLGMTALAALLGCQPDYQVVRRPEAVVAETGAPERVREVVLRAIDYEPGARQSTAADFARELRAAMRPPPVVVAGGANGGLRPAMVHIPAGEFVMGSPAAEPGRDDDEGPQRRVALTRRFLLARTPVTQAQYAAVMQGARPSRFTDDAHPVEQVSWFDAVAFCNALSAREGRSLAYAIDGASVSWVREADGYRLPTEAEWEYACRAGTATATYAGPLEILGACNAPALDAIAWYGGNSGSSHADAVDSSKWPEKQAPHRRAATHPVGLKRPNGWGLHDMLGNVLEWVWDRWANDYGGAVTTDPTGPPAGAVRVFRGGSFVSVARSVRSAYRSWGLPGYRGHYLGFRVALPPENVGPGS